MRVVFVHGWSVTNTDTYGGLPEALRLNAPRDMDLKVDHLYLGKYVSFADEVMVDDIARGMEAAVARRGGAAAREGRALRLRDAFDWRARGARWIHLFYGARSPSVRWAISSCWRRRIMVRHWRSWARASSRA